jgi:hemoglobin/transferrin/lactoferrin receptor protein
MRSYIVSFVLLLCSLSVSVPAFAGDLQGRVTDHTGGVLPGALVRLLNIASGIESSTTTDGTGHYKFTNLTAGLYRVAASLQGFSDASRSVIVSSPSVSLSVNFALELGALRTDVTVTAARGARDTQVVPLRADTLTGDAVRQLAAPSTGDVLVTVPGVTPVGSGPFQVRPRLRGLDSTRVLVLVDGERLNNARTATDRAGVEVGLVDTDSIEAIEVLGGAGSVLYGTDALSGTINIITNRPKLSDMPRFMAGFDGLYSSNENGRRGTVSVGVSTRRLAVSFTGGAEHFDDYQAGKDYRESSVPFFTNGTISQVDTIDTNFGFNFHAFPEGFNAPFTRTSAEIPRSNMEGTSANLAAVAQIAANQRLDVKYQRRNATNVGFPDFEQPYFFQTITLPYSRLEKYSASYSVVNLATWMPKLTATVYLQHQDRLLRNDFPVQFPAPSATFFPISVFRLNILSDTRQEVWTPGVDVQATVLTHPNNLVTAGMTTFEDRSRDQRTTTTQMNLVGLVDLGQFGPAATVFASPIPLGGPTVNNPVRVPDARFRDVAAFVQDEWDVTPALRLSGGLRVDAYRVTTNPTTGYSVESLVSGAVPAIDPSTLPDVNGDRISRTAVTGEAGAVLWATRPVSLFGHYVHSYRHPNLEELLFSGPATTGNIVPNVKVEPETGHNVDVGARFRASNISGSVAYFNNRYHGFISTEVVANSPAGSISQAVNLAAVRIQGIETQADAPFVAGGLAWAPYTTFSWTRGTVLSGTSPLSGVSLAGVPQDNITPWKFAGGLRVGDRSDRWWVAYGVRSEGKVNRVSPLLSDSPFLIAQDLLALGGFTIHRVAAGYDWRKGNQRVGFTLAVDNLTDKFYREQFQFAPARGRSISLAVHIRGIQ